MRDAQDERRAQAEVWVAEHRNQLVGLASAAGSELAGRAGLEVAVRLRGVQYVLRARPGRVRLLVDDDARIRAVKAG